MSTLGTVAQVFACVSLSSLYSPGKTRTLYAANGGIGIINSFSQNRFIGCYLDGNDLVLQGARGAALIDVSGGFFLGGGRLVFQALAPNDDVFGVSVVGNEFQGHATNPPFAVDERLGNWTSVTNLFIAGTMPSRNMELYYGVTASSLIPSGTTDVWTFDFSSKLLFPNVPIDPMSVSVQLLSSDLASGSKGQVYVANVTGQVVTVLAPDTANGPFTMRASVSQSVTTAV